MALPNAHGGSGASKGQSKDEKTAVAGGIAVFIVIILMLGWGIWFFKKIQSGQQQINLDSGAQGDFNFTATRQAQQQLQNAYGDDTEELKTIRDTSAAQQVGNTQGTQMQQTGTGGSDQFGIQN